MWMGAHENIRTGIDRLFRIIHSLCRREFYVFCAKMHKGNRDFSRSFCLANHFYPMTATVQKVHQVRTIVRKLLPVQTIGKVHKSKTDPVFVESVNGILT